MTCRIENYLISSCGRAIMTVSIQLRCVASLCVGVLTASFINVTKEKLRSRPSRETPPVSVSNTSLLHGNLLRHIFLSVSQNGVVALKWILTPYQCVAQLIKIHHFIALIAALIGGVCWVLGTVISHKRIALILVRLCLN